MNQKLTLASDSKKTHYFYYFVLTLLFTILFNHSLRSVSVLRWGLMAFFIFTFLLTYKMYFTFDPRYSLWILVFIGFACASIIWAESASNAFSVAQTLISNVITLMIIRSGIKTKKDIELILMSFVISCFINGIYILSYSKESLLALNDAIGYEYRLGMNMEGGEWNANTIGLMMSTSVVSLLYFFKKINSKLMRLLIIGLNVFFISLALLSGSRKALIMIILGLLLYLFLTSKGKIVRNVIVVLIAIYVIMYAVQNIPFFYKTLGYRVEGLMAFITGEGTVDNSTVVRNQIIDAAMQVFKQYPITGCGINCFSMFNVSITGYELYSHNNFTELLSCLGIIGFSLYYSGYAYIIYSLFIKRKKDELTSLLFSAILITTILEYAFVSYYDFMIGLIVMLCFAVVSINNDNELSVSNIDQGD